ncbi:MAG: hypothetical protein BEN18_01915 [Epulopiscium sp. Nuni2H_MBin001]|nr:MAG: hypothetical protein BEN18_01915 [Epulopiscium sp. Nuni2H_MBin001]
MARVSRKNKATNITPIQVVIPTAFYIRSSHEDVTLDGTIGNQQALLENYISDKPDFQLIEKYIDNGYTGTSSSRPEFKRMLADIESNKIKCVIVKDLSRLGRNMLDTGFYTEKYFPQLGVRFISVTDNYDSYTLNNMDLTLPIKNMVNEAYSRDLSKKIKTQRQIAMKAGDYVKAVPYGYKRSVENPKRLVIDKEAADTVKRIFDMIDSGLSYRIVSNILNAEGIFVPIEYAKLKKGITNLEPNLNRCWNASRIVNILKQESYTGKTVQGKTVKYENVAMPVSPDQWIVVENTHEAIISQEVFDRIKEKLLSRKINAVPVENRKPNIFARKLFCKCCGVPLERKTKRKGVYSFVCPTAINNAIACDNLKQLPENKIINVLKEIFIMYLDVVVEQKVMVNNYLRQTKQTKQHLKNNLQKLGKDIEDIKRYQLRLYETFASGDINSLEYKEFKLNYEEKLADKQQEYHKVATNIDKEVKAFSLLSDFEIDLRHLITNNSLTKLDIDKYIKRIEYLAPNQIDVQFTFKDMLAELTEDVENAENSLLYATISRRY